MKKPLLLFLFTSFLFTGLLSSQISAQYNLDTLVKKQVGPGVMYYKFREPVAPNVIYMMEVDLKNPYIKMETAKGKDLKEGLEKPSAMAAKADSAGHRVIGIVNSDFFLSNGEPDNMQVKGGEVTRRQRGGAYAAVAFDTMNNYMLALPSFKGTVITKTGGISIYGVDEARPADKLVIYNSYHGSSTGAQTSGTEAVVTPIGGWFTNDTVSCIVKSIAKTTGNTPINKFDMVLSAHGSSDSLLTAANLKAGDTLRVYIGVGPGPKKIRELVGGRPIFMKKGVLDSSITTISVVAVRNPRTLVGFSEDSTKCYILVIDGRQSFSVGMDVFEMAKLMKQLKIYNAMNFDGGGSACMVIDKVILNSPSDGPERAVSNGLMVISTAPVNIQSISLSAKYYRIFRNDKYNFVTTGFDEFGSSITMPATKIQYSCDSRIGSISPAGLFTAAGRADSGYVYAKFDNFKDSCLIKTYDLKYFSIRPKNTVTDTLRSLKLNIDTFDADSVKHDLALSEFKWTSTNPSAGTVDAAGIFTAKNNGDTKIIASCSGYSDTCFISVQSAAGLVALDALDNTGGWTFTGDNLDSLKVTLSADQKSAGSASFKIDYKFTYSTATYYNNYIYLSKDIPVYGIPDSIYIDAKSDGRKHKIFYRFADDNSELFRASGNKYLDNTLIFDRVNAPMTALMAVTQDAEFNYPLTLKRIEIQLAGDMIDGQATSGTIYIDNLKLKYPGNVTEVESRNLTPGKFSLEQNYPNPFNPSTVIGFNLVKSGKASLKVYDLLAREVATLFDFELKAGYHSFTFNASGLPSGIYLYRLQTNENSVTKKMLLLK